MPGLGATGHILTAITVSKADETTRQVASEVSIENRHKSNTNDEDKEIGNHEDTAIDKDKEIRHVLRLDNMGCLGRVGP